jgi:hypothetical protein
MVVVVENCTFKNVSNPTVEMIFSTIDVNFPLELNKL